MPHIVDGVSDRSLAHLNGILHGNTVSRAVVATLAEVVILNQLMVAQALLAPQAEDRSGALVESCSQVLDARPPWLACVR